MKITDMWLEGGKLMAQLSMTEEDCRKFVNDVFNAVLGKDFDYVIQAVKEKIIRDGEIDGEEDVSELSTEDTGNEGENSCNVSIGDTKDKGRSNAGSCQDIRGQV